MQTSRMHSRRSALRFLAAPALLRPVGRFAFSTIGAGLIALSEAPYAQTSASTQKVTVRFATNRNETGGDEMFGSGFRSVDPSAFVTGTVDVYIAVASLIQIGALIQIACTSIPRQRQFWPLLPIS